MGNLFGKKPLLIVANWKMQLTHVESLAFIDQYMPMYEDLLSRTSLSLVLCPSFTVLPLVATFNARYVQWGAQTCASQLRGAYTGDISVLSLKELGILYTLIGHSEQRRYHGETDESVARKAELLLQYGICPIICVGESENERATKGTLGLLKRQLKSILELSITYPEAELIIAYEPLWAIGTGVTPSVEEVAEVYSFIVDYFTPSQHRIKILYGGSVSFHTKELFERVPLDGYLLGKQGIDAETLKKIILLW